MLLAAVAAAAFTVLIAAAQERPNDRYLFREMFVWRHVDFAWAHDSDKARALDARLFQPENCAVQALRVWRGRLFVTLPRWRAGVPATLAWLPADAPGAPPLRPFPSWEMQVPRNCSAMQSAQALAVTPEGRLWVVDGGRADFLETNGDACPPKILVFDVDARDPAASRLWKVLPLPQNVLPRAGDSAFADIAVDADDVAFVSDASASEPGVVVVDARSGRAWKARHESSMRADAFAPAPPQGLAGGVSALALAGGALYYAPLRSLQVFAADSAVLRDEQVATMGSALDKHVRVVMRNAWPTHALAADARGDLYLGLNGNRSVARWDATRAQLQVLARDAERLQWPSAFALDDAGFLWVVSNRLPNFLARSVSVDEPNYRVMRAFVGEEGGAQTGATQTPAGGPTTYSVLNDPDDRSQADFASFNYTTHGNHSAHEGAGGAGALAAVAALVSAAALGSLFV